MELSRNDKNKPLIQSGRKRHGFFGHHHEECLLENWGQCWEGDAPVRLFWCATHGQWAYERPVKTNYTFGDGEVVEKISERR